MTHAEHLYKLTKQIKALGNTYTREELRDIFKSAKELMMFAAFEAMEFDDE